MKIRKKKDTKLERKHKFCADSSIRQCLNGNEGREFFILIKTKNVYTEFI